MSGASIAAMLQTIRSNRILLKSRRKAFDKNSAKETTLHKELKYKQVPPQQTQQYLQDFKTKKMLEKRVRILLWVFGILLIGYVIFLISN